jgi:Tfp pilus assembly protein FimV
MTSRTLSSAMAPGVAQAGAASRAARAGAASPPPRAVRQAGRRPVRLTRRGRLVLVLLLALLATTAFGAGRVSAGDESAHLTSVRQVTVAPGETLWSIARRLARPEDDPRQIVARVMELNGLPGDGRLRAGQRLAVPVGGPG